MKLFSITILLSLLFNQIMYAQTAIGKTSTSNPSVSLEFGDDARGLILPYVRNTLIMENIVPGTLIMDVETKRIRLLKAPNNWFDLSSDIENFSFGNYNIPSTKGHVDNSKQINIKERNNSSVIIGIGNKNTAEGAVILADPNKAMILPKMESPHLKIVDPAPGMMAYDTVTQQLAVFNGTVWTFWK